MHKWIILIPLLSLVALRVDAESLDLATAIQIAIRNSPFALALQKEKSITEAEVEIEKQLNNPGLIAETTRSQPNYFLGGGYLLELGGKRSKRVKIASGAVSIAELNYRLGLQILKHDVRIAFYTLLLSRKKTQELGLSRDLSNKLLEITKQRFETGDVARLEVLEAELEFKRRENDFRLAEGEEKSALVQLNSLLHRNPEDPVEITASMEDHPLSLIADALTDRAIANHLTLQVIREQQKTEEARLKLAQAERIPDLDLEAGTEIHDADFQYGWRAGVHMDLPLFNRKQGEINRAHASMEKLRAEEDAATQKLRAEISAAYFRYQTTVLQSQNFFKDILPASVEIEQLAVESYQAGRTGILAVIDAQRSVRQVRVEYLDLLMQLQTALADLEQTTGMDLK